MIKYIKYDFSIFDLLEIQRENQLRVDYPNNFTLYVFLYDTDENIPLYTRKEFVVQVLYNNDCHKPIYELNSDWRTLKETLTNVIERIDKKI